MKTSNLDCDFDSLVKEVLSNPDARRAYLENQLLGQIAQTLAAEIKKQSLSSKQISMISGLPKKEIISLLRENGEVGGNSSLRCLVGVADVLGLEVKVSFNEKKKSV